MGVSEHVPRTRIAVSTALVAQLVAVGALIWVASRQVPPATGSFASIVPSSPVAALPITIEQAIAIVQPVANEWSPSAALVSASAMISWPGDAAPAVPGGLPTTGWLAYVYADRGSVLTLYVDRGSGTIFSRSARRLEPLPSRRLPALTPAVSSNVAALTAEVLGGQTYRAACPDQRRQVWIDAEPDDGGGIDWIVTYRQASLPDANGLLVRIDGAKGNVESNVQQEQACD